MTSRTLATLGILGLAAVMFWLTALPGAVEETAAIPGTDVVVACYFHPNLPCATCRRIEALTDEAIHSGFATALASGALSSRVVNVDETGNKHFIEDFQLVTRSVVLAEYRDGKVVRWKSLDKVWQLVRDRGGLHRRRFVRDPALDAIPHLMRGSQLEEERKS